MNYTSKIVIMSYRSTDDEKGMEFANANACNSVSGALAKNNRGEFELHVHSCKEKYTRDGDLSP